MLCREAINAYTHARLQPELPCAYLIQFPLSVCNKDLVLSSLVKLSASEAEVYPFRAIADPQEGVSIRGTVSHFMAVSVQSGKRSREAPATIITQICTDDVCFILSFIIVYPV